MTIAACHISPEGVVLGADSTTTITNNDGDQAGATSHFDYAQKIFEIGPPGSTVGSVAWGIGQIGETSHRLRLARLGRRHERRPFRSLRAMAQSLAADIEQDLERAYPTVLARVRDIDARKKDPDAEVSAFDHAFFENTYLKLSGGFCLAGRLDDCVACEGFAVSWTPLSAPSVEPIQKETPMFWGVPEIFERLLYGLDSRTLAALLASGKWIGTHEEMFRIVSARQLLQPTHLPIREAIDWIHTIIHTTIRGVKFANWPHVCGGPIEIAVITADRPFRWVRHKRLDAAILTAQEMTGDEARGQ